jgi:hypothetical protein
VCNAAYAALGYCYPSGLEKTLCKWEIYVPLVTKGLRQNINNVEKLVTRLSIFLRKWNFEVLRNVTFPLPASSHLI